MAARLYLVLALGALAACGRTPPPTPSPPGTPGEAITGRERLGWDQQARDAAELATFRYAIYVDGVRSEVADVTCGATAGAAGFACSGRLPVLSNGAHTLELAAFILDAGGTLESGRSAPLTVTVAGLAAPPPIAAPLAAGETIATADGVRFEAQQLAGDLHDVVDLALLPDGRSLVGERSGSIRLVSRAPGSAPPSPALRRSVDGGVAALAVAADFARTAYVFVIHTPAGAFRLVRYRLAGDALVDRMPLMRDVAASAENAAALRAGRDGQLYAAFDDGGSREAASRPSEWNGKILRINADGSTPGDQPAASPVYWSGLRAPRGLGWAADGVLWFTEERGDRTERLAAIGVASIRPRRASQRASYPLPQPFGVRTLAFHAGGDVPALDGNLLIAASDAGHVLRIRFDAGDAGRIVTTERLLDGRVGPVRAVAVGSGGAIYVASDSALWRLIPHAP
ncbi:MAG TPA: PQQ-dependent sugar dehydrogenase [Vicinamibacterales bacterium]|nr:PQQ-dependent sugar dehydrogenase [Vicinamibacterales bacterium]